MIFRPCLSARRLSKSDGSQVLAPQRDTLHAAGVGAERIYQDLASGRLKASRAREMTEQMMAAGPPV